MRKEIVSFPTVHSITPTVVASVITVKGRPQVVIVLSRSFRFEQRRADANDRRSFLDGNFKITAHSHRKLV